MSDTEHTTDANVEAEQQAAKAKKQAKQPKFTFTDPGCRTEIRFGGLCVLAGVFLWQWWLPLAQIAVVVGLPLVLIGVPLQVRDARKRGRPGYPWKLAVTMTIIGICLLADQFYREGINEPLKMVVPWVPVLLFSGLWMLIGWPLAKPSAAVVEAAA